MQATIVDFSKLDKRILRLEAEFYASNKLMSTNTCLGEDVIDFVQYGTSKELNEDGKGYPVLRLNEYESYFIKKPAKYCEKIDNNTHLSLKLCSGDVLICRTNGNPKLVGKSAIVMEDTDFSFASYLYRIRPKKKIITSATLMIYLNSKYGRSEIERYLMVSNQANFSPAKFREIAIPILGKLNNKIDLLANQSYILLNKSSHFYSQAAQLLLDELDLSGWQAEHKLSFVKNYLNTKKAERMDAEYFQPKYDEIVTAVKQYKGGWDTLGSLPVRIKDRNFNPAIETSYKYIELANIGTNGWIEGCSEETGRELPTRARRKVNTGDVIVSSIEGSLSSIAIITAEFDNAICSTGFYVVTSQKINSETLFCFLKSLAGQLQLKKGCNGTILTAISKDEFSQIVIPKIKNKIQEKLKDKIRQSFEARHKSKQLLEIAKQAVELTIEKDEKTAMAWIEQQGNFQE